MATKNIRSPWSLAWKVLEATLQEFTPATRARLLSNVLWSVDANDAPERMRTPDFSETTRELWILLDEKAAQDGWQRQPKKGGA
jgi:hypothetical protein